MSRRIEIELTSRRPDESWTWRAAGALQPRGVVENDLLPPSAKVGDLLRVEIDTGLDGIVVTSVLPTRAPHKEPDRIELAASRADHVAGVTTTLVAKPPRRARERRRDDRERERPHNTSPNTGRPEGSPPRRARTTGDGPLVEGAERPGAKGARTRPPRLVPKTIHRDALFSTLPPEQRPIAEQLAIGGLAAVRRALAEQQGTARGEGNDDAIVALAEGLLPAVREATWLDRAEAAVGRLETITLRDLRATVTGAAPRDDEGRAVLATLRQALEERLTKLRSKWEQEISHALEEGRVLQALRLSAKPPEPASRFPSSLIEALSKAAGAALSAATPPDRWISLLEAAAASPIRRLIKPSGIPSDPANAARQAAAAAAGRVPALARLLGLAIPPPPRPLVSIRPGPAPSTTPPATTSMANEEA